MKRKYIFIIAWVTIFLVIAVLVNAKSKEEIINNMPGLLKRLDTSKGEMRWHIIYDLGYSGDQRAVDPLIKILTDKKENIWYRRIAAYALGLNGNSKAIPHLKDNLQSSDEELKLNSAGALILLGDKETGYPIIEDLIEKGNVKALEYLIVRENGTVTKVRDSQSKDILIKSLDNATDRVRVNSAMFLIRSNTIEKNSNVFYNLSDDILKNSKDFGAIEGAISILKNIGDEKAKEVLQNSLKTNKEEDVKRQINSAIKDIQEKQ